MDPVQPLSKASTLGVAKRNGVSPGHFFQESTGHDAIASIRHGEVLWIPEINGSALCAHPALVARVTIIDGARHGPTPAQFDPLRVCQAGLVDRILRCITRGSARYRL
jgi:hypothetical protein